MGRKISFTLSFVNNVLIRTNFYSSSRTLGWVLVGVWVVCLGTTLVSGDEKINNENRRAIEHFELKVRPVLAESCQSCHGSKKQKGGLRLDSREAILKGGESGPAIVPGNAKASLLYQAIRHEDLEMPPKKKLSNRKIQAIGQWIQAGAPWPKSDHPEVDLEDTAFKVTEEDRDYWAFRVIKKSPLPETTNSTWIQQPFDAYVLRKLEDQGLKPNPKASPRELIRRLHFDLTGLPPTQEEVDSFLKDPSPTAYSQRIDDLLARPQFGVRWGRHWLDVVRYAQTNGYERDDEKPLAWRYRDYVINSFNQNKPYDQFLKEQLAGDEIENVTPDSLVATGFYRLNVWDDEPDDKLNARYDELDDIIRTTSSAFLGLTLGCARCHRHMYDPISQAEYYKFLSFFHNIRPYDRPRYQLGSPTYVPLAEPSQLARWQKGHRSQIEKFKAELASLPKDKKNEGKRKELENKIKNLEKQQPPFEWGLAITESGPKAPTTHVLTRGNAHNKEAEVHPGFPEVLDAQGQSFISLAQPKNTSPSKTSSGRRLLLTQWMTHPNHPLTARVMVNRLWQHLLGRGLSQTPNDFGRAGLAPTHPQVLDWLAKDFIEKDWSIKSTIKTILLSSTYQLSSQAQQPTALAKDPGNDLFWRQNLKRLEAEAIRDSILQVSDVIDHSFGGRGFFPKLSREVIAGGSRPGRGWEYPKGNQQRRRSAYIFIKRTMGVPLLESFDYVNTSQPIGARPTTTVAPQALMLLNSNFLKKQAELFAQRLNQEKHKTENALIQRAFQIAISRKASSRELIIATNFLKRQREAQSKIIPNLTFNPLVPKALFDGYKNQIPQNEFLEGPRYQWKFYRGVWEDKGDSIQWVKEAQTPFGLFQGLTYTSGSITTRLKISENSELVGLILKGTAEGDRLKGYELQFDPERKTVTLLRVDNGTQMLAQIVNQNLRGRWVEIRSKIKEGDIELVLNSDNQLTIKTQDPNPIKGPGRFGVKAWGSYTKLEKAIIKTDQWTSDLIQVDQQARQQYEKDAPDEALKALCLLILNLNEFIYID